MLAWCRNSGNEQALSTFSSELVAKPQVAVSQKARKLQTQREKVWGMYHIPFAPVTGSAIAGKSFCMSHLDVRPAPYAINM